MASIEDFHKIDIRVGKIIEADLIPEGKYSTHKLLIDFGKEIGIKKSCARLIDYEIKDLLGRQILAVVNFPKRQIGKNTSEVLTLGVPNEKGDCVLIKPDDRVGEGVKLF